MKILSFLILITILATSVFATTNEDYRKMINDAVMIKLGISDFEVKTSFISPQYNSEFSKIVSDAFINIIKNSSQNIRIIDCRNSNSSEKYDYMLLGAITDVKHDNKISTDNKRKGGIFNQKLNVITTYSNTYEITLEAKIIEAAKSSIISSITKTGGADLNFTVEFEAGNMDSHQKMIQEITKKSDSMSSHAIKAACSGLADKIREFFSKEYVLVDEVQKNNVIINRGSKNGVETENFYRIFSEGEKIFDLDGRFLGHDDFNIAVVKVKKVYDNFCSCEIISGKSSSIQKGHRAEIITPSEADKLSNGKSKQNNQNKPQKSKYKSKKY